MSIIKNKLILISIIFFMLIVSSCGPRMVVKRDYDFAKINTIAVVEFEDFGIFYNSGDIVADEFIYQFMYWGLNVVERTKLNAIMEEQNLGKSGRIDAQTAKQIGKLLGADVIVTGTVTRFNPDLRRVVYIRDSQGNVVSEMYITEAEIGVSARMIDVETGAVVWANSYEYISFDTWSAVRGVVSAMVNSLRKVVPQMKKIG